MYFLLGIEYSLERKIFDTNFFIFEFFLGSFFNSWSSISLLSLILNKANNCAWGFAGIAGLEIVRMVGTIWICLADSYYLILECDSDLCITERTISLAGLS